MNEKEIQERLSTLTWLIDRYDVLRVAISRRAAIVLSADAILVTATIVILGRFPEKIIENPNAIPENEHGYILAIIALSVLAIALLALSILRATYSIVNVWATSHEMLGGGTPDMLFFHARDTFEKLKDFKTFKEKLDNSSNAEILTYAEAELWRVTVATYYRHGDLKTAIKYLYYAIYPFFLIQLAFAAMLIRNLVY